jgi:hypothetical protein
MKNEHTVRRSVMCTLMQRRHSVFAVSRREQSARHVLATFQPRKSAWRETILGKLKRRPRGLHLFAP